MASDPSRLVLSDEDQLLIALIYATLHLDSLSVDEDLSRAIVNGLELIAHHVGQISDEAKDRLAARVQVFIQSQMFSPDEARIVREAWVGEIGILTS